MPKPANPFDLIRWEQGAPRFNAKPEQGGLSGFWDHYQEARLFFLVCAQPKVEDTDYVGKAQLHRFIKSMLQDIPDSWQTALPHDTHWKKFHTSQVRDAMERKGMGLIKSLQAAVVIEHYLNSVGVDTSSYYDEIYITPATYRVIANDQRFMPDPADPALAALMAIGQPSPSYVLTEHSQGQHVCYPAARSIAAGEGGVQIDFARRIGEKGATKPACKSLLYQCV